MEFVNFSYNKHHNSYKKSDDGECKVSKSDYEAACAESKEIGLDVDKYKTKSKVVECSLHKVRDRVEWIFNDRVEWIFNNISTTDNDKTLCLDNDKIREVIADKGWKRAEIMMQFKKFQEEFVKLLCKEQSAYRYNAIVASIKEIRKDDAAKKLREDYIQDMVSKKMNAYNEATRLLIDNNYDYTVALKEASDTVVEYVKELIEVHKQAVVQAGEKFN